MFAWTEEKIEYYKSASERTEFYDRLAAYLAGKMSPCASAADIGAGLGYLSLALSPYLKAVYAVEKDEKALNVLREKIGQSGCGNVTPILSDAAALPANFSCDYLVFCYYGSIDEILKITKKHCRKKAFVITKRYENHRFRLKEEKIIGHGYAAFCEALSREKISYTTHEMDLEYGQPLRGIEDAKRFFSLYDPGDFGEELIAGRLVETGEDEFPYYLPSTKKIGIIEIDKEDL